jgi:hypothetical protein
MAEIVSYTHVTTCTVPEQGWDEAFFALQTWKGYLQSFPGMNAVRISAKPLDNGDVRVHVYTQWQYPEELEEWLQSKVSAVYVLNSIEQKPYDMEDRIVEDFS